MQSDRSQQRDRQIVNPLTLRPAVNTRISSAGTDSSTGISHFNPGFALESESAIEADASTVGDDSDSTAFHSGSNAPIDARNRSALAKSERWSQKIINSSLSDRGVHSVDSDTSSSPTFEKAVLSGYPSQSTAESRKPVATDIPTPSSGYQADTEVLENEEWVSNGNSQQQQHHHHHHHHHNQQQNQYSSSMDY
ncbi:hypothetical protein INT44_008308 [Umbelopsis vinacea]|uniref:Uncharacterized protein n=1 Tax=Umbelopsis vinacea TaxID=44442 RepID=A0A8H7PX35_9FUNG|nr:hypothetical protein INT44_008308 [Umbelopsis vinacea]